MCVQLFTCSSIGCDMQELGHKRCMFLARVAISCGSADLCSSVSVLWKCPGALLLCTLLMCGACTTNVTQMQSRQSTLWYVQPCCGMFMPCLLPLHPPLRLTCCYLGCGCLA
jgi:hypothetical protein